MDNKFLLFFLMVVMACGVLLVAAEGGYLGHAGSSLFSAFTGETQATSTTTSQGWYTHVPLIGGYLQGFYDTFTWNYSVLNDNPIGEMVRWLILFPITTVAFFMLIFAALGTLASFVP